MKFSETSLNNDFSIVRNQMLGESIEYVLFEKDGVRRISSEEEANEYYSEHGLIALKYFHNVIESFENKEDIVLTDWYKMTHRNNTKE